VGVNDDLGRAAGSSDVGKRPIYNMITGEDRAGPAPILLTGHATREELGSMIRRCITWRDNHALDQRLTPPGRRQGERCLMRH
jgi:hypothetical protein